MGLYVEGFLVDAAVLKQADRAGNGGLYAFTVEDEDGGRIEVLTQEVLGAEGEVVKLAVNAQVRKDKTGKLVDRVSFWVKRDRQAAAATALPGFARSADRSAA